MYVLSKPMSVTLLTLIKLPFFRMNVMLLFFFVVIGVNIRKKTILTSVHTKMSKNTHKFLCRLGIKYHYFGYLFFNGNILARYEVPLKPLKIRI